MNNEPKISFAEILLITPFFLIADAINIFLIFLGSDDFFIVDMIRFPISQIYLRMKGVKATVDLATNLLEMIPYVGALPLSTIGWCIAVWMDRRQAARAMPQGEVDAAA